MYLGLFGQKHIHTINCSVVVWANTEFASVSYQQSKILTPCRCIIIITVHVTIFMVSSNKEFPDLYTVYMSLMINKTYVL